MTNEHGAPRKSIGMGWPIAIIISTIFLMGIVAGYLDAMAENGGNGPSSSIGAGLVLLLGIAAMALYVRRAGKFWQGWSRRKRLYWASLGGAALLGVMSAALLQSGDVELGVDALFTNGALSPSIAIALSLLWAVGLAITMTIYHRAIDDHEERAWLWAGLAGWYAFIVPAPAWWILHRASLAPPADVMLLFVLSMVVNAIVYLWLKFR
ncbi:MAG: hypothetical protein Q7T68_12320 [Sphingopyxis sp.]|nr:hypothetical protein [Sphingopyxis sp.]